MTLHHHEPDTLPDPDPLHRYEIVTIQVHSIVLKFSETSCYLTILLRFYLWRQKVVRSLQQKSCSIAQYYGIFLYTQNGYTKQLIENHLFDGSNE